jgi:hypothetical protein
MAVNEPATGMTGVCVVRTDFDTSEGMRIAVTARTDVDDESSESSCNTTSIDAAVVQVRTFLLSYRHRQVKDDGCSDGPSPQVTER